MSTTLESNTIEDPAAGPLADAALGAGDGADGHEDVETTARRMGWLPKDEFKGHADAWRPAEEFLERGSTLLPVMRQNLRALNDRYSRQERELRTYKEESLATLNDLTERLRRADERAYQRAVTELQAKRNAAVESGDSAAFQAAETEMRALEQTAPPPVPAARAPVPAAASAGPPPEVMAWVDRNPWFRSDEDARADAVAIQGRIDQTHAHLPLSERLELTRQKVARLHPHLFENARRAAPAPVSASTSTPRQAPNPRSFDAMPADSKAAFERYRRQLEGKGKPLTKEEWATTYWENEA